MNRLTGPRRPGSANDPGVANAWDSSDARGAYEDALPVRPKLPLMSRHYASMGLDVGMARVSFLRANPPP